MRSNVILNDKLGYYEIREVYFQQYFDFDDGVIKEKYIGLYYHIDRNW